MSNNELERTYPRETRCAYGPPEVPLKLFSDRAVSDGAKLLLCYLVTRCRETDGRMHISVVVAAKHLGVAAADVQTWLDELNDRLWISYSRPSQHLSARLVIRDWDDAACDEFRQTMEALSFPESLQLYYEEIYVGLQAYARGLVRMRNLSILQRVLNRAGHLQEKGLVDWRGPVGLVIHELRRLLAVPRRDFSAENGSREGPPELEGPAPAWEG